MNVKEDSIFVQIPAYRDTQLVDTLNSLLENAYNPERLNITICWQHSEFESLPPTLTNLKNINIVDIDYKQSRGCSWARSIVQQYWNNEPFTLLLDSHLRFVKNWDKKLLAMMLQLKQNNIAKPIISVLPPPFYDPAVYPQNRMNYPLKIYPKEYEHNLLIRFCGLPLPLYKWLKSPIPAQFIAMGFLFAEGVFNYEVPIDPNIYFFGDDITTALRAYCYGYDFYHPHRIIAWHLYDRQTRVPHWDDHDSWGELNTESFKRVKAVLTGKNFEGFALGKERTVKDYETYIGKNLLVADEAD